MTEIAIKDLGPVNVPVAPAVQGMAGRDVIVGVEPSRIEHGDAIALGAMLARMGDARLVLATVYEPDGPHTGAVHEHALRKAVAFHRDRLAGLEVEQLVLPGASAARILHALADQRRAQALVVGSSPRAPWGHVELGHVSQRVLHGGAAPTVVAPRGFASRGTVIRSVGVGYVNTPESEDALRAGAALAMSVGASLRLLTVFDPADYAHGSFEFDTESDLRRQAQHALDMAVASVEDSFTSGQLIDGDPAEVLVGVSPQYDLLVLGSRSHGPLRAVLLGMISGELVHRAVCPVMVVPHVPDRAHEVALVGGLEAQVGV